MVTYSPSYTLPHHLIQGNGVEIRSRKKKQRLRSRNDVVDEWLEQEDGQDTFADLEDFLVFE